MGLYPSELLPKKVEFIRQIDEFYKMIFLDENIAK